MINLGPNMKTTLKLAKSPAGESVIWGFAWKISRNIFKLALNFSIYVIINQYQKSNIQRTVWNSDSICVCDEMFCKSISACIYTESQRPPWCRFLGPTGPRRTEVSQEVLANLKIEDIVEVGSLWITWETDQGHIKEELQTMRLTRIWDFSGTFP